MPVKTPFLELSSGDLDYLLGGCHCGRNKYVINLPDDADEKCHVIFNTSPGHQAVLGTPLPGFLRVPLDYFKSSTFALSDDETATKIHRVYEPDTAECAQHRFCGFCGTPLTYWCESPHSEADYIKVTLGSLYTTGLKDLSDMGFVKLEEPKTEKTERELEGEVVGGKEDEDDAPKMDVADKSPFTSIPWFDAFIQDTLFGSLHPGVVRGSVEETENSEGKIRVEWEITEWDDDASSVDDEGDAAGMDWMTCDNGSTKRKLDDLEGTVAPAAVV